MSLRRLCLRSLFQSAPPAEARGDRGLSPSELIRSRLLSFNPLPLPKQGEISKHSPDKRVALRLTVSIRSPCRSKGRFQHRAQDPCCLDIVVNPLPLPKQGEILASAR